MRKMIGDKQNTQTIHCIFLDSDSEYQKKHALKPFSLFSRQPCSKTNHSHAEYTKMEHTLGTDDFLTIQLSIL